MKKILIIQDSPALIAILKMWLQKEGYNVDFFETGEECLKVAEKSNYDLILLDYNLPGINGDKVCRHLKNSEKTKNIPVIFLSAADEGKLRSIVSDVGADGFIIMPFENESIIQQIESLLDTNR